MAFREVQVHEIREVLRLWLTLVANSAGESAFVRRGELVLDLVF